MRYIKYETNPQSTIITTLWGVYRPHRRRTVSSGIPENSSTMTLPDLSRSRYSGLRSGQDNRSIWIQSFDSSSVPYSDLRLLSSAYVNSSRLDGRSSSVMPLQEVQYDQSDMLKLRRMFQDEDYGTGVFNASDYFFRELLKKDRAEAFSMLNDLYVNSVDEPKMLQGILNILANLDYQDASSNGVIIAMGALNHIDTGVKEYAVKCFDSWYDIDSKEEIIKVLKNTHISEKWLAEYLEKVICELESLVG